MNMQKAVQAVISGRQEEATHAVRVAYHARILAAELACNEDDVEKVFLGGILHDFGKSFIPEAVLLKPGKLTPEEYAIVRQHSLLGFQALCDETDIAEETLDVVRFHHERFDGTGYPEGRRGEEIPGFARIVAITEAFDAMVTASHCRAAVRWETAMEEIDRCKGTQFDPAYASAFLRVIGKFRPL